MSKAYEIPITSLITVLLRAFWKVDRENRAQLLPLAVKTVFFAELEAAEVAVVEPALLLPAEIGGELMVDEVVVSGWCEEGITIRKCEEVGEEGPSILGG